jgi:hypothetical protein
MMRWRRLWVGLLAVGLGVGTLTTAAAEAAPFCGQVWGSLPEAVGQGPGGPLITNVRAGRHACFDRLVIDLNGPSFGYHVSYEPAVLRQGSGDPIPLRGGAFLDVTVYAFTYDLNGTPTFSPADRANVVNVSGFRTLRQVADGGSFEGYTTFGVGVRARLPFRVFVLPGPGAGSRLVIDIGHRW